MAIHLLNSFENSNLGMSPRISFSHDVCQSDIVTVDPARSDSLLMDQSNDFDFCTSDNSFEHDYSSCADELFSDGKLLPLQIKKQSLPPSSKPPTHPKKDKDITENPSPSPSPSLPSSSPSLSSSPSSSSSSSSKSFWRFKRSSSCGNGYTRSLICSLPLLSRSNSTGSTPPPKRTSNTNNSNNSSKTHSSLKGTNAYTKSSSSSSSSSYPYPTSHKKYNNGVRISPVLNVPPPYISKGTVNLFGLGSLFSNGKDKNKKKKSDFS